MEFHFGNPSLICLDHSDFAAALSGRAKFSVFMENGFDAKRIAPKLKNATGILIGLQLRHDMTLEDGSKVIKSLCKRAAKNAKVVWTATLAKEPMLFVMAGW